MKILIIGHGGREHAITWKIVQSPLVNLVFVAPGNAGTALEPYVKNININIMDIKSLLNFAKKEKIDLTIVGPEAPLVYGIVDIFRISGLRILGPTKNAAQLEGSKIFAKKFLYRHNIPTAEYKIFNKSELALNYIKKIDLPVVIKANGLAAGKGAIIASNFNEAKLAIENFLINKKFGKAGSLIIIEKFLEGEEISFIVMVDGKNILPITTSQDYKRVGNNDTGPNTGGMGACSPSPIITKKIFHSIMEQIIIPTVKGMESEGNVYSGFLYAGLIIDQFGNPKVIEFNCRLGDPETQPIMLRMRSDFADLCIAICDGRLNEKYCIWDDRVALSVVIAANGYPGIYCIGDEIHSLPLIKEDTYNVKIFHSGTKMLSDGRIITNGGRVLCLTSLGNSFKEAKRNVYSLINEINWNGGFNRDDIGYRAIFSKKIK